jgi:hypothetical protein
VAWTYFRGSGVYWLDRLLTVVVSAAFGFVGLTMFQRGWLKLFVASAILPYVVFSALVLLTLVAVRVLTVAEAVCGLTDQESPNNMRWDLSPVINYHGSDYGWVPVRYVVLSVPLLLYAFDLPLNSFAAKPVGPTPLEISIRELNSASSSAWQREMLEGQMVRVTGQCIRSQNGTIFTLLGPEVEPFYSTILACRLMDFPEEEGRDYLTRLRGTTVEAVGRVQFWASNEQATAWVPILLVHPTARLPLDQLVRPTESNVNPFR